MTRVEIERLLTNMAETTRYLRESNRLIREHAERTVAVTDHMSEVIMRIDAALDELRRRGDEERDT
jgi:hypothetical protein